MTPLTHRILSYTIRSIPVYIGAVALLGPFILIQEARKWVEFIDVLFP